MCAASRTWCACEPRSSRVASAAMPMLPPIVRMKLKRPEAWPSSRIGTALSATVDSGTNVKPIPSPWMKRGSMIRQ
jgi:hypothetical protein